MAIRNLLYDPDQFFNQVSKNTTTIGPLVIVTLAAISSVLSTGIVFIRFAESVPENHSTVLEISMAIGAVMGFLSVYLGWFVVSLLLYGMTTRVFGVNTEGFRTFFWTTGWGFLPSIPAGLLSASASYLVYYSVQIPSDPQNLGSFANSLSSSPIFTVSRAGAVMFTVWQGFLWMFVIKNTTELDTRRAGLIAAVPCILIILVQIFA